MHGGKAGVAACEEDGDGRAMRSMSHKRWGREVTGVDLCHEREEEEEN